MEVLVVGAVLLLRHEHVGHVRVLGAVDLGVKYAEADAGCGEVASDGELDGGEAVVGEHVCAGDDGQDVDAAGEAANGGDVCLGQRRAAEQRVARHGGLEDDGLVLAAAGVGVRREGVRARAVHDERDGGRGDKGRHDVVWVEEVDASVNEKRGTVSAQVDFNLDNGGGNGGGVYCSLGSRYHGSRDACAYA